MIYFITILFLLMFVVVYDVIRYRKGYNLCLLLTLFIFILISGLRYKVGGDTLVYMEEYEWLPTLGELSAFDISETRYDYLWVIFCAFCKIFSENYFFMQFIQAVIINTIYFYYIYKNTPYRFGAILLYFVLGFLYFNTEIMREAVAISVFLLAIKLYYDKQWIKYYVLCTIALFIHSSAFLLFFLPFVSGIKLNNRFFYSILVLTALSTVLWQQFNEYIQYFAIISSIQSKVTSYLDNMDFVPNFNGILFGVLMYVLLPLSFAFMAKRKGYSAVKEAPFLWLYIVFGIFTIFNGTVFTRFQNYLFFPFIVFLSNYFFESNYKKAGYQLKVLPLFIILVMSKYFNYFKYETDGTTYMYQRYFPYNSVITKKNIPWRE